MGKVIAVSNHKGGVGKTTSTVNIGACLSTRGKRVLLIDIDPQANLTDNLLGVEPTKTIYGAMTGEYPIHPIQVSKNLYVVGSTLDLCGAEIELSSKIGRESILRDLLKPIKNDYDYIFIDCPPSLDLLTLNAITAAEEVYISLHTQYFSIKGLKKLMKIIGLVQQKLNKKLTISGVILTNVDARTILERDVASQAKEHFKDRVFNTMIRKNISLAEAQMKGKDIFSYNPDSNGASDYSELCNEILAREEKK